MTAVVLAVLAVAVWAAPAWAEPDGATVQAGGYSDVGSGHFAAGQIAALAAAGVFDGTDCSSGRFCPDEPLPRWIMAVWLVRVLDGREPAPAGASRFADVDAGEWWAAHTERFAMLGVTKGCAITPQNRYCPYDSVDRGQMAAFLVRGFDLASASPAGFADTAGSYFESDIDSLAAAGVTAGCDAGPPARYCPSGAVTRAQMAVFIHRALNPQAPSAGAPRVALESSAPLVTGGEFDVILSFSTPVTGLSRTDVSVVNGRAANLTGSGARYTARIVPAGEGAVLVSLPAGAARADDGSPNAASAPLVRTSARTARPDPPGIDTWNRPLVLLHNWVEFSREEPDWQFTGDLGGCVAGSTGAEFRSSVIQRVNWYRQMAGMGTVTEDPELSADAQLTALMMLAEDELSHYPGRDWGCHSDVGEAIAAKSNLGLGNAGVAGIDAYMRDDGDNNLPVGHRRWILYPQILEMGTGNMRDPRGSYMWTSNALDVISGDRLSQRPDVREERGFVAWPPPGYVPSQTVWGRWSFSLPGADFSNASVAVADASGAVAVEILDRHSNIGEPGIVWAVAGDTNSYLLPLPRGGDHCYAVTVSGVTIDHAVEAPYEYATCVIDPHAPTGPSVALSSDAPDTISGAFEVDISFSEPVTGFTSEDVFVINGTVQALTGSGRDYTATISADDDGAVVTTVGAGAVHDRDSRPNTAAVPLRRTARGERATVAVTSSAGRTVSGSFDVAITFSKPVTGFSAAGIRVVNATVSNFSGSGGASYRATITPSSPGTVMVRVRQDAATTSGGGGNLVSPLLTRLNSASGRGPAPGIDTWSRGHVIRALQDSGWDEPDWGYTADLSLCIAGTTSQAFRSNVLARLNWYRVMAGVPAAVEDTSDSAAAQIVAMMYILNDSFTFTRSSKCYSEFGDEASGNGPGWLGRAGIDAIDANMESRVYNKRREMLTPWLARVGIGHAKDPDSTYGVAHMLHTDYNDPWNDPRPAVREERGFVAWPPAGHVIDDSVWEKWSFSLPDADFSAATVERRRPLRPAAGHHPRHRLVAPRELHLLVHHTPGQLHQQTQADRRRPLLHRHHQRRQGQQRDPDPLPIRHLHHRNRPLTHPTRHTG